VPAKLCRRPEERPAVKIIAGSKPAAVRGIIAAGRPGMFKTKILIETELFLYFLKKITNFGVESGATTNAKEVDGSSGRLVNRRPLKTRYMRSKILILNFMDFKGL